MKDHTLPLPPKLKAMCLPVIITENKGTCSECICPTNVLQLKEGRKEGRKEGENQKGREREKEGRRENEGESEREGTANEREGESARLNTP